MLLTAFELVIHAVAFIDNRDGSILSEVRRWWDSSCQELALAEPVLAPRLQTGLPVTDDWPQGPVAAVAAAGPGQFEGYVTRQRDVVVMSFVVAPDTPEGGWSTIWQRCDHLDLQPGFLHTTLIFQAKTLPPPAPPDVPSVPMVAALLPPDVVGTAATSLQAGRYTEHQLWVAECGSNSDDRTLRVFAVIAAHDQDSTLSASTWTRPGLVLPSLVPYLLHAARIRHLLRLLGEDEDAQSNLLHATDPVVQRLAVLARQLGAGTGITARDLQAARGDLIGLQALQAQAIVRATWLSAMARSAAISGHNLQLFDPRDSGRHDLIDDDLAVARYVGQRLADAHTYTQAAIDRVAGVSAIVDQLTQQHHDRIAEVDRVRRERFGLLQTAIIGALLMALTAVQSLAYQVPLPGDVKPPIIAALASAALYLSASAVRVALYDRGWQTRALESFGAGLVAASLAWLTGSSVFVATSTPAWTTFTSAGLGSVVAAAYFLHRHRRAGRGGDHG